MKKFINPRPPCWLAALLLAAGRVPEAAGNPTGLTVVSGTASLQTSGSQLNVNVGQVAVLNWLSFNIAAGETTQFIQPSRNSVVLNYIGSASPSQIYGSLTANGTVILENQYGFYFGPNSFVSVGGSFIATTAQAPVDMGSGGGWQFTGMPPLASIVNYGQINVGQGKSLFLIAENIDNEGGLNAPGGNIDLAAGQQVLVSETPDGRGLSAAVTLPAGSVDNFGRVTADGGSIAVQAQVVNQNGLLQADSVQNVNGTIELVASESLTLGASSQISASGDASAAGSAGGAVTLQSGGTFSDVAGSEIVVTGGANGGNGGEVEVSTPNILSLNSSMNASAASGSTGGQLVLDPVNITLVSSGTTTTAPNSSGTVDGSGNPTANWNINVSSAFLNKNFSQITLEASGNITLSTSLNWNLSATTGETAGTLTLEAGQNIIFGKNAAITDANSWNVNLLAGVSDFSSGTIQSGQGNIFLNGSTGAAVNNFNGSIQTAAGNINLQAGESIQAGTGSVYTTGGGNLFAEALGGSIDTGLLPTATSDYIFGASGATPNSVLGGFSTAAGGNVTLIAGNSISPTANLNTPSPTGSYKWPGESGAYGGGDVTVIAGNQITGNYIATAGTGSLLAGAPVSQLTAADNTLLQSHGPGFSALVNELAASLEATPNGNADIGTASAPIILSTSAGTWNVFSADDIYLNEVNNPDGTFDTSLAFQFNYAATAAANFWAYDAITIEGGAGSQLLPRTRNNSSMTPIYTPQLSLNAGAGGITLENSLILFPSTEGSLAITTRNGGDLTGLNGAEITMSDSADTAYGGGNDFTFNPATDATVPLALNNPNGPAQINVSGNWTDLGLNLPEAADINVLGNINNVSLQAWNLHSSDATTINVGTAAKQAMENNGVLDPTMDSSLTVGGDLNLNASQLLVSGPGSFDINANTIEMDSSASITAGEAITPATSVTLTGALPTATEFNSDLSSDPTLAAKLQYDPLTGTLTYAGVMSPTEYATLQTALGAADSTAVQQLHTENQKDILGANLNLTTAGNLTMTLTTSIVNYGVHGDLSLNIGGAMDIGNPASDFNSQNQPTAGIITTSGGNISVIANGAINVNQSRIATYDGGNLTVVALNGDINCGNGSAGITFVNEAYELNPTTGQLVDLLATLGPNLGGGLGFGIAGSGIRANTFVDGTANLGNILVEAPNGTINASAGGIVALRYNNQTTQTTDPVLDVFAGYELQNPNGQLLSANDLSSADTLDAIHLTTTAADPYADNQLVNSSGQEIGQLIRVSENENVNAENSGIIGSAVTVMATGTVSGLVVGKEVTVKAPNLGPLIVFSQNTPTVTGISTSGGDPIIVTPTVDTAAAPVAAAAAVAQVADNADTVTTKTQTDTGGFDDGDDDAKKRGKGKKIGLEQKVSRVTVLLPSKN